MAPSTCCANCCADGSPPGCGWPACSLARAAVLTWRRRSSGPPGAAAPRGGHALLQSLDRAAAAAGAAAAAVAGPGRVRRLPLSWRGRATGGATSVDHGRRSRVDIRVPDERSDAATTPLTRYAGRQPGSDTAAAPPRGWRPADQHQARSYRGQHRAQSRTAARRRRRPSTASPSRSACPVPAVLLDQVARATRLVRPSAASTGGPPSAAVSSLVRVDHCRRVICSGVSGGCARASPRRPDDGRCR